MHHIDLEFLDSKLLTPQQALFVKHQRLIQNIILCWSSVDCAIQETTKMAIIRDWGPFWGQLEKLRKGLARAHTIITH